MAKKRDGNGGGNGHGNGHDSNGSAQVEAIQHLEKTMLEGFTRFTEGFLHLEARVDSLSDLIRQTNGRLDQLIVNSSSHWRSLSQRVDSLEQKMKRAGR